MRKRNLNFVYLLFVYMPENEWNDNYTEMRIECSQKMIVTIDLVITNTLTCIHLLHIESITSMHSNSNGINFESVQFTLFICFAISAGHSTESIVVIIVIIIVVNKTIHYDITSNDLGVVIKIDRITSDALVAFESKIDRKKRSVKRFLQNETNNECKYSLCNILIQYMCVCVRVNSVTWLG